MNATRGRQQGQTIFIVTHNQESIAGGFDAFRLLSALPLYGLPHGMFNLESFEHVINGLPSQPAEKRYNFCALLKT
jgi:hypothetical protein